MPRESGMRMDSIVVGDPSGGEPANGVCIGQRSGANIVTLGFFAKGSLMPLLWVDVISVKQGTRPRAVATSRVSLAVLHEPLSERCSIVCRVQSGPKRRSTAACSTSSSLSSRRRRYSSRPIRCPMPPANCVSPPHNHRSGLTIQAAAFCAPNILYAAADHAIGSPPFSASSQGVSDLLCNWDLVLAS